MISAPVAGESSDRRACFPTHALYRTGGADKSRTHTRGPTSGGNIAACLQRRPLSCGKTEDASANEVILKYLEATTVKYARFGLGYLLSQTRTFGVSVDKIRY